MPAQITEYKCPACTGPLHFVGESGKLECDYCGQSYDVAEIEALYAGQEAKAEAAFQQAEAKGENGEPGEEPAWDTSALQGDWGADGEGMKAYSCPSCGAELICEATTAATSCPYCGNNTIVPGQFGGTMKPDYGEEKSGELLLLSMEERDYALIAYGYGNTAFTDYGKDKLTEKFLDNFKNDDWCGGFQDYLEKSDSMLQSAREGHPFDVDSNPLIRLAGIGISLLVGCVAAFVIAVWVSDRMMKSVSAKTEAGAYLTAGSVVITGREDYFTHTTETRTKIEKSSGSGGTTVDSDGFSGKSGKF